MALITLLALVPATECLVAPRRPARPARAARLGATPSGGDARYYLGIDLSTQSCTAIVVDAALDVAHRASVNFDASFPAYGTSNGMHATDDGVATSPVAMWLDGLDAVLELIPASLRQQVDGVSFSGQQHGSVYWSAAAAARLAGGAAPRDERPPADCYTKRARGRPLPAGLPGGFREALAPEAFAVADAPIWADASTRDQCDALEAAMGGPAAVAAATGSRAYARFTGHQMAALAARDPDAWQRTARVSLVSSFGPSLLCGAFAPVDASDSCGTNPRGTLRPEWHVRSFERFDTSTSVVLRALDESHRPVQKSAESTSTRPSSRGLKFGRNSPSPRLICAQARTSAPSRRARGTRAPWRPSGPWPASAAARRSSSASARRPSRPATRPAPWPPGSRGASASGRRARASGGRRRRSTRARATTPARPRAWGCPSPATWP